MKKNIKRYLSYVLGVILAMGLGLSYAYAVGANDSNAFVTTTEWETKVAQIEASLDNVTKTINDTNMDFVMNGPRLQLNLIDGLENCIAQRGQNGDLGNGNYHDPTLTSIQNLYSQYNGLMLSDKYNGLQSVETLIYPNSNQTGTMYSLKCRFALRTTTPGYFIIVSKYTQHHLYTFHYARTDVTVPYESTISAKTLTVRLPRDKWLYYANSAGGSGAVPRTNSGVWSGNTGTRSWMQNSNANLDGYTVNSGYVTKTINTNETEFIFEFPAEYYTMRVIIANFFNLHPIDMQGKRFAANETVNTSPLGGANVAEVYSPMKGCMCLKSYKNGEIPILN